MSGRRLINKVQGLGILHWSSVHYPAGRSYLQTSGQVGSPDTLELLVFQQNQEGGDPLNYFQSQYHRILLRKMKRKGRRWVDQRYLARWLDICLCCTCLSLANPIEPSSSHCHWLSLKHCSLSPVSLSPLQHHPLSFPN